MDITCEISLGSFTNNDNIEVISLEFSKDNDNIDVISLESTENDIDVISLELSKDYDNDNDVDNILKFRKEMQQEITTFFKKLGKYEYINKSKKSKKAGFYVLGCNKVFMKIPQTKLFYQKKKMSRHDPGVNPDNMVIMIDNVRGCKYSFRCKSNRNILDRFGTHDLIHDRFPCCKHWHGQTGASFVRLKEFEKYVYKIINFILCVFKSDTFIPPEIIFVIVNHMWRIVFFS